MLVTDQLIYEMCTQYKIQNSREEIFHDRLQERQIFPEQRNK